MVVGSRPLTLFDLELPNLRKGTSIDLPLP